MSFKHLSTGFTFPSLKIFLKWNCFENFKKAISLHAIYYYSSSIAIPVMETEHYPEVSPPQVEGITSQ